QRNPRSHWSALSSSLLLSLVFQQPIQTSRGERLSKGAAVKVLAVLSPEVLHPHQLRAALFSGCPRQLDIQDCTPAESLVGQKSDAAERDILDQDLAPRSPLVERPTG